MQTNDNSSDDSDELYMPGSSASDSIQSDAEDDDDVLYQLNDTMDGSNYMENDQAWSGTRLKSNLVDYDGILKLTSDVASELPKNPSPIDLFRLFLTPESVSYIVDQSNLYRIQSNKTKQEPMTESDFYALLGFLFYGSILPLPSKRDYWSSFCRQTTVADAITRDRLVYLLSILHFHDNAIERDKAEKVVSLIRYFNERCKTVVESEQHLSIDEQMIGYKGTTAPTSLRQYMPKKPTKRGFKVWTKCGISGFVYEMKLYKGSLKTVPTDDSRIDTSSTIATRSTTVASSTNSSHYSANERKELEKLYGMSGMIVLDFMNNVPLGSFIFVDNYFSSTKLIHKMTDLGYGITCTLRPNRINNCPFSTEDEFKRKPRGYHECFISDNDQCAIVAWKDSKRVLLGSNYVSVAPETTLKRWDKLNRCYVDVQTPQIVTCYNKSMGGVDTLDMLVALHPIPFRSKKWYIRIVWRIFDLMVINSWILMKNGGSPNNIGTKSSGVFRLFHFKSEIAKILLHRPNFRPLKPVDASSSTEADGSDEEDEPPKKKIRERSSYVPKTLRYDGFNHWPVFVSAVNNTRCKNEKCNGKTYWKCDKCNVHLCLNSNRNCFTQYHAEI